eukprot:4416257-Prymnesium_polylepis.1
MWLIEVAHRVGNSLRGTGRIGKRLRPTPPSTGRRHTCAHLAYSFAREPHTLNWANTCYYTLGEYLLLHTGRILVINIKTYVGGIADAML